MRALKVASLAATVALLPGCIFAVNTGDTLEERIGKLEKRVQALEQEGRGGSVAGSGEQIRIIPDSP